MGAGETGTVGACVLPLVEEGKRLENACATTQSHPTVVAPVQETRLRYPGAIYRHAQVSNQVKFWQNYCWHIHSFRKLKTGVTEPINYKTVLSLRGKFRENVLTSSG